MAAEPFFDLSKMDLNRVIYGPDEIRKRNPHRFELELLDAIVHFDPQTMDCVGYHDLREDAFWVRGHVPGMPLFPGALMIEAAAQLSSFSYHEKFGNDPNSMFGFGGIERVKFRQQGRPGQRFYLLCKDLLFNRRLSRFAVQGVLNGRMAFEAEIVGVTIARPNASQQSADT
ncbi:MAG: beta-hydroxyacyl-ACP dehydratase [Planctomycetes bacterium]|nr:beta-hydroxyacyl-ACP dehydratase [Planctomycetota bacterium]